jgi:hypothetical protein
MLGALARGGPLRAICVVNPSGSRRKPLQRAEETDMDSYKTMVLTLIMAVALGVGGAFMLTSNSNVGGQYGQRGQTQTFPGPQAFPGQQAFMGAPAAPPMDCSQFRGTLAENDCLTLNQHYGLPPRESQIYNAATLVLTRQKAQTGAAVVPSPQAAYALAQQMGVYQKDAPLVFQAMQDAYKRGILQEQRAQMLSELQSAPAK